MKKALFIVCIAALAACSLAAQSPKRELRAVWLTTAWSNDWPKDKISSGAVESAKEKTRASQKEELTDMFDKLKANNINTVYFQVRSMCDAMYKSTYEPWSQFLSNKRGTDPGYDPLAFAVEEAHKRGLELHAWVNPYRYSSAPSTHGNLPDDYAQKRPEWLIDYGQGVKILNPGVPKVRQRIVDVITEIVTNYDIDGVLFDDYFYVRDSEKGLVTTDAMDQKEFEAYNTDGLSRDDWRRQNVNKMMADVYAAIKSVKPYVAFGVGPAGVASSNADVATGHGVRPSPGSDWQYSGIFSDPVAWLKQGTIDYISPQLYWPLIVSSTSGQYERLTEWWSEVANRFGRYYYSSNSVSGMKSSADTKSAKVQPEVYELAGEEVPAYALSSLEQGLLMQKNEIGTREAKPTDLTYAEMAREARLNREYDWNAAPGFVFFAAAQTLGNHKYPAYADFLPYMKQEVFQRPALNPSFPWIKAKKEHGFVDNITLSGQKLTWRYADADVRYAVYAVPNANRNDDYVFSNSKYLLGISYDPQYTLSFGINGSNHKIGVSVLDRYGNEAPVRVMGEPLAAAPEVQLLAPANGADDLVLPCYFTWQKVEDAYSYRVEVSCDADFRTVLYSKEVQDERLFSGNSFTLYEEQDYYWRVKAYRANAPVGVSEVRLFGGQPFQVVSPADSTTGVGLTPVVRWVDVNEHAEYTVEISESGSFYGDNVLATETLRGTEWTVPDKVLAMGRTYFLRVTARYDGYTIYTPLSVFSTMTIAAETPEILSPVDGAHLDGTTIRVVWREQVASDFQAKLSQKATFPPRETDLIPTDAYTYEALFENLASGTYYLQVLASGAGGLSDPSPTVTVYLGVSGISAIQAEDEFYAYYEQERLHVVLHSDIDTDIVLSLYTPAGVLIHTMDCHLHAGKNVLTPDLGACPKGIYILKVTPKYPVLFRSVGKGDLEKHTMVVIK